MSCTFEDELTAYVDGELPAARRAEVEAHLGTCPDCRATEGLLRRTVERLPALPEFLPSPSLRREVLAKVDALPPTLGERLRALLRPSVLVLRLGSGEPSLDVMDPGVLELAANMELVEDYEVAGLEAVDDLEVVAHLHELEVQ